VVFLSFVVCCFFLLFLSFLLFVVSFSFFFVACLFVCLFLSFLLFLCFPLFYFILFLFIFIFMALPIYTVALLGDGGSGKSALIKRLIDNRFEDGYGLPSIEDIYRKQVTIDDEPCILELIDLPGQALMFPVNHLIDNSISKAEGFLLLYSIISTTSFHELSGWKELIDQVKGVKRVPLVLVATHCDLESSRTVENHLGLQLAHELGDVPFIETSAAKRINIEEAFFQVVKEIRMFRLQAKETKGKQSKKFW